MIPAQLVAASRPYRHAEKDELVRAFDWYKTIKVVEVLVDELKLAHWIRDEQQKTMQSLDDEIDQLRDEIWELRNDTR